MLQPENEESNNSININSIKEEGEDGIEMNGVIAKTGDPVMKVELKFEEDIIESENSWEDPEINENPVTAIVTKSQEDDSDPEWCLDEEATTSTTGRSPYVKKVKKKSADRKEERKRSNVWLHFSTVGDDTAVCRYCRRSLSFTGGSTGNLLRHLKMKHPKIPLSTKYIPCNKLSRNMSYSAEQQIAVSLKKIQESDVDNSINSTSMNSRVAPLSVMDILKFNDETIDKQLIKMIVKELHNFSLVEEKEFKKFVHLLCPTYKLPSKKNLVHNIFPTLYEATAVKIKHKINCASSFCLTTDAWTSTNNFNFLEITVHFLDDQLQLCSHLLGCFDFDECDSTKKLSSKIINLCKEWNIEKIEAAITDKTFNISAIIQECGIRRIPCFAHTINMFVQVFLKHISPVVDKVQLIVQYFKQCSVALNKLYETQKEMKKPEMKLKQGITSHWISIYIMLSRILKNKEPLNTTVQALQLQNEFILSDNDWEIINSSVDILSIFNDFIVEISNEKTLFLSKTLILTKIMISGVNKSLQKPNMFKDIKNIGEEILNLIRKWLSQMEANDFIAQATFLDPRFKNHGFLNDSAFIECKNKIICMVENIDVNENEMSATSEITTKESETSLLWADFDAEILGSHPSSAAVLEIDGYMNEPLLPRTGDPFVWWKQRDSVYPRLYSLVQKRLFIPATSIPCKRMFTKAGIAAAEKRKHLLPKNLSKILFLSHNLD